MKTKILLGITLLGIGACNEILGMDELAPFPPARGGNGGVGGQLGVGGAAGGEPASCGDNAKNGDETDVDCGGSCSPCEDSKSCELYTDCKSGFCDGSACTPCSAHAHCQSGHFCDLFSQNGGSCAQKYMMGVACNSDDQCSSGYCADSVCCDTECAETCAACTKVKTGGQDGTCAPVTKGLDPDVECTDQGPSSCGAKGSGCSGVAGLCEVYDESTECAPQTCKSATELAAPSFCDGKGTCASSTPVTCSPYACNQVAAKCYSSCSKDSHCDDGNVCGCIAATCGSADNTPNPPSCSGLPDSCGPNSSSNCCLSSLVPCGSFYRSYDGVTYLGTNNPATVSDFRLDLYEVTVGRFRKFVNAGGGTQSTPPVVGAGAHPKIAQSGWGLNWYQNLPVDTAALKASLACDGAFHTWTDNPGANETRPIGCVDYYVAFAFCIWDGGRLPTEAEWNYAAAGGDEQREYPWGSGVDLSFASYGCTGDGFGGCTLADILSVGTKSPKGMADGVTVTSQATCMSGHWIGTPPGTLIHATIVRI